MPHRSNKRHRLNNPKSLLVCQEKETWSEVKSTWKKPTQISAKTTLVAAEDTSLAFRKLEPDRSYAG